MSVSGLGSFMDWTNWSFCKVRNGCTPQLMVLGSWSGCLAFQGVCALCRDSPYLIYGMILEHFRRYHCAIFGRYPCAIFRRYPCAIFSKQTWGMLIFVTNFCVSMYLDTLIKINEVKCRLALGKGSISLVKEYSMQ